MSVAPARSRAEGLVCLASESKMSSPEIWDVRPLDEAARARHRSLAHHRLDQARAATARLQGEIEAIIRCGGNLADDLSPIEEVEASVNVLSEEGDGSAAVVRAEQYLVHVHAAEARLIRRRAQLEAETVYRGRLQEIESREVQRLTQLAKALAAPESKRYKLARTEGAPGKSASTRPMPVARMIASILASAATEQEQQALAARIEALARLPERERILKLDTLRSVREQEIKNRLFAETTRIEAERKNKAAFDSATLTLARLEAVLDEQEDTRAELFRSQLAELRSKAHAIDEKTFRANADELSEQIEAARRKEVVLRAVATALQPYGYEAITEMDTLTAKDMQGLYLEDHRDPERLVHLGYGQGLLRAEVVRHGNSHGTTEERERDRQSQQQLCEALESARQSLASAFSVTIKEKVAPGRPLEVHASVPVGRSGRRRQTQFIRPKKASR